MNKLTFTTIVTTLLLLIGLTAKAAVPVITLVSPNSGHVGNTVVITGNNFNTTAANNVVIFGATRAAVTSATTNSLTVKIPAGATYSQITVLDASTGLLGFSPLNFIPTYDNSGYDTVINFTPKIDFATSGMGYSVVMGDIDGDGKADIIVANSNINTVSVFRNTSSVGTISFAPKVDIITSANPYCVAIGDIDGDGKADLATSNITFNDVSILRNVSSPGTINFADKVDYPAGETAWGIAIGDLDNDGKADIAVNGYNIDSVSILRNVGTVGTISFAPRTNYATDAGPDCIAISDIDGDGLQDLVIGNFNGTGLSILRNTSSTGNINFEPPFTYDGGGGNVGVAVGDIDGDNKNDIAFTNIAPVSHAIRNTGSVGSLGFSGVLDCSTGYPSYGLSLGDLDGDGRPDMAVTDESWPGSVSIVRNMSSNGSINYGPQMVFSTGDLPYSVAIGDIDGDGKPDLAVVNEGDTTVSILRNNPLPVTSAVTNTNIASHTVTLFPNPCHDELDITFVAQRENVTITLSDIIGRRIAVIAKDEQINGAQHIIYNTTALTNGVYYLRVDIGNEVMIKKVTLE